MYIYTLREYIYIFLKCIAMYGTYSHLIFYPHPQLSIFIPGCTYKMYLSPLTCHHLKQTLLKFVTLPLFL